VQLGGEVECDEVYDVAGHKGHPEAVRKEGRPGRRRRLKGAPGRGTLAKEKPPVFGMIQRGGQVVIRMLADVKQKTIGPLIRRTIAPGTVICTDEYDIYARLPQWGPRTAPSVMRRASSPVMRTATGSARSTSTRWRGCGRWCGAGSGRTGGSRRSGCRYTWGSSSSCTTSGGGARPCWSR